MLGLTGAGLLAGVAGGAGISLARPAEARVAQGVVPFADTHQAGISTPVQDRLHFTAFDVTTTSRDDLVRLLREWTEAASRMCRGLEAEPDGAVGGSTYGPPTDTGEALGLPASRLTITIGFGPTLFDGRFGLASKRPAQLKELPVFPGDALEPQRSGGDLVIQACADDPQVAVHAVRNLARIGFGKVSVRWSQLGFGKTSSTTPEAQTPRNLFGFKDGTNNPSERDTSVLDDHVWVGPDQGPDWMVGGSYLVARRIRMHIETWDRESLGGQENIIGRNKGEGAPLGMSRERDLVNPHALPVDSHVALVHPSVHGGATMLRRGYSFVDGSDGLGRLDAGLFFIAFVRDPETHFTPVMAQMARSDALQEYLRHTSSGVWAVPPGVREGGYWGEGLFV